MINRLDENNDSTPMELSIALNKIENLAFELMNACTWKLLRGIYACVLKLFRKRQDTYLLKEWFNLKGVP